MHGATQAQQRQVVFEELREEFGERAKDLGTVVVKQGKASTVDHVHVLGLPLLGKTHASIGNGLIHIASVLGQRLPAATCPDGGGCGELVTGGAEAEAYRCCQIVEQILKSCNVAWGSLVRLTVHVPGLTASKLEAIEHVIDQFFEEKECPAITKTAVGCASLRFAASVQMEGIALLPAPDLAQALPAPPGPPPGLERMPDSPPLTCISDSGLQRQISETLAEFEDDSSDTTGARKQQGAWLVVDTGDDQRGAEMPCNSEPAQEPAPEGAPPEARSASAADKHEVRSTLGLVGQMTSVYVTELPSQDRQLRKLHFQGHHDCFRKVEMLANKVYRTVRLDPSAFVCQRLPQQEYAGSSSRSGVWCYTFDVAVTRTTNSFINVGLVEWIAKASEPSPGDVHGAEPTLAQLLGARGSGGTESWQHVSESPRQIMLGCRKGVKWYGNSCWENLFKDDMCEGSLLQFLCDFVMDELGVVRRMRLWLLPSNVIFRKRGWQCVKLARPLCEWAPPPAGTDPGSRTCSLWVPAVTLFSQEDAVVVSWRQGAEGRL